MLLAVLTPFLAFPQNWGNVSHFDTRNGLSTNYVTDIVQDRRGVMWIASDAGINRFDGVNFKSYSLYLDSLAANTVSSILYDEDDDFLWVGTRCGLGRLNCLTGEFSKVVLPDEAWVDNVSKILPASDGGVWIISHYYNVVYIDSEDNVEVFHSKDIPGLISSFTTGVDDGRGNLIVGNEYGGLSVLDIKERKSRFFDNGDMHASTPVTQIYDIITDSRGNVWFSGNHGITLFRPVGGKFYSFNSRENLNNDRIYSLKEISNGTILAGGDLGSVNIFNPTSVIPGDESSLRMERHNVRGYGSGVSTGNIRSICEDSFGNIWLCNYGKGLEVIKHSEPLFFRLPYLESHGSGFDNHDVWSVFMGCNGSAVLGGTNSIGTYDGGGKINTMFVPSVLTHKFSRVSSLFCRGSEIFMGFYDDGLLKYDTASNSVVRIDMWSNDIGVNTFLSVGDSIFMGTSKGVRFYHDNTVGRIQSIDEVINGLSVTGIVKDTNGNFWIGTYGAGVFVFDSGFNKVHQIEAAQLHGGAIKEIYMDSYGYMWIVSKESLAYVKNTDLPASLQLITYPKDEYPTIFRGIIEDRWGNIWVSTDSGLMEWLRRDETLHIFRASPQNGFSSFNDRAIGLDSFGRIVLGSGDGAWIFDPKRIETMKEANSVVIMECIAIDPEAKAMGKVMRVSDDGTLKMTYDSSSFSVFFTVPDVSQASDIEYEVMLEGLDTGWSSPISENHVTYRMLPPGKYKFNVRARLPHQPWNDDIIASMDIEVAPPFWSTWWARTAYVLLLLLAIGLWIRHYSQRLQKRSSVEVERQQEENERALNNERLRFYTNITHELRTPLTLILGPLEDMMSDSLLPQMHKAKITTIHKSANRLLNLVNQLLEFRKVETQNRKLCVRKGNLGNVITELGLRYQELYHNDEVKFVMDVQNADEQIYFDIDIITSVVSNLLSNAMKYTSKGHILLALKYIDQNGEKYAEITVEDTGYGIESSALPHIFDRYYQAKGGYQACGTGIGLALVKSLAEVHGGSITVESKPGKGSTFRFRILTECTYPEALHSDSDDSDVEVEIDPETTCDEDKDMRPLILIVEDNSDIRDYIKGALSDSFRIIQANDGKEGYEQAVRKNPDIIISDIMMPVMDGLQMLKKIKEDASTSHIPVILLTAKDSMVDKEIGYENGADSYLTKPFSAKLLKSRINNILSARKKLVSSLTEMMAGKNSTESLDSAATGVEEVRLSKIDSEFLEKFTKLIEDNLTHPNLDMNFIQNRLNMSRSTLYRKIKGITGMSGNEFIRKVKLRHALGLLREGYSVSEASYDSGFNDVAYFRDCFKEEYGDSPSRYIRKTP